MTWEETGAVLRRVGKVFDCSEENLADLLAALPPAPAAWVAAACELPAASDAIDEIVSRTLAAREARAAALADLEAALRQAGVEPTRVTVAELRRRLEAPPA